MSRVWTVALREFKYTALTKAFILGAIVFPLAIWFAFPVIIALTEEKIPPLDGTIAVIDPTGEVSAAATREFERSPGEERKEVMQNLADQVTRDPTGALTDLADHVESAAALAGPEAAGNVTLEVHQSGTALGDLKERVRTGSLVAVVQIDPGVVDVERLRDGARADGDTDRTTDGDAKAEPDVVIYAATNMHPGHSRLIRRRLGDAVVRVRAARLGEDVDTLEAILARPSIRTRSLTQDGAEAKEQADLKEMLPLLFAVLLAVTTFTSGQYLLTTTIEEKSNKVMEVLLSAVSPMQLMTGKILGQWLVSLVMLVMYGGLFVMALIFFAAGDLVGWTDLACFAVYFVMAYFFTAAVMASVGSAVSDIHDAQSLMLPAVFILLMAPMLLMIPASQNPGGTLATVVGFIPPLIPYVMIVRITAGDVPAWQIALSMVIGLGAAGGGLWLAAKIFRVGVLMYGKPPSPLQMLRWVRYS